MIRLSVPQEADLLITLELVNSFVQQMLIAALCSTVPRVPSPAGFNPLKRLVCRPERIKSCCHERRGQRTPDVVHQLCQTKSMLEKVTV